MSVHRLPKAVRRRAGAAALECAIVLPVTLFVLFSLLDLGLAAIRYNSLADGSRRVARAAIIHGSLAPDTTGHWGPAQFVGAAADSSPMLASLSNFLPTMNPEDVNVQITWLDGGNDPRDRVQVQLNYEHETLVPFLAGWGPIDLHSATTMRIVN